MLSLLLDNNSICQNSNFLKSETNFLFRSLGGGIFSCRKGSILQGYEFLAMAQLFGCQWAQYFLFENFWRPIGVSDCKNNNN